MLAVYEHFSNLTVNEMIIAGNIPLPIAEVRRTCRMLVSGKKLWCYRDKTTVEWRYCLIGTRPEYRTIPR